MGVSGRLSSSTSATIEHGQRGLGSKSVKVDVCLLAVGRGAGVKGKLRLRCLGDGLVAKSLGDLPVDMSPKFLDLQVWEKCKERKMVCSSTETSCPHGVVRLVERSTAASLAMVFPTHHAGCVVPNRRVDIFAEAKRPCVQTPQRHPAPTT